MQVRAIPVADSIIPYLSDVLTQFKKAGIRIDIDSSDDRMQKKVRNAQLEKIPFMMIAGDEDMALNAVSFRYRNGEQKNQIPIQQAIDEVLASIKDRKQI